MLRFVFLVSLNLMKKIGLSIMFNYDCWSLYFNITVALCLSFRKYDSGLENFEISSGSTSKLEQQDISPKMYLWKILITSPNTNICNDFENGASHRELLCYATFNNLRRLWSTLYSGNIRAPIYIPDYNPLLRSNILTTLDGIFISRVTCALEQHLWIN